EKGKAKRQARPPSRGGHLPAQRPHYSSGGGGCAPKPELLQFFLEGDSGKNPSSWSRPGVVGRSPGPPALMALPLRRAIGVLAGRVAVRRAALREPARLALGGAGTEVGDLHRPPAASGELPRGLSWAEAGRPGGMRANHPLVPERCPSARRD